MAACTATLDEWSGFPKPGEDEDAQVSLHWAKPASKSEVAPAVEAAVAPHRFTLAPAFPQAYAEENETEFWLLAFPQLTAVATERLAFELARCLRAALPVQSVRPILVDSLVGAAVAVSLPPPGAEAEAIFGRLCNSDDAGPEARGWAPLALGIRKAWTHTRGAGVTIASIDTGYSDHRQLQGVLSITKAHLNLVEPGTPATDRFSKDVLLANPGHGTLVASVVASRGDIDAQGDTEGLDGVTGAAPEAEILPVRAIRSVVDIRQSRVPAAIEHAIRQECDVIVMALGSPFVIEPVEAALRQAAAAGIVTICAAGNCYGPVVFPAKMAPLGLSAAIAGVDFAYQPWEKTSKGPEVTASAFGEAVWGARKRKATDPDAVAPSQGTTLAASLTAGVAALWVAHHGRDKLRDIARRGGVTVQRLFNEALQRTAYRPSGWPNGMGAGLVNAGALLEHDLEGPAVPADVPVSAAAVTPLSRFLATAVSDAEPLAGIEGAQLAEDYAAEALWRFYVASARARAEAAGAPAPPADDSGGPTGRGRSEGLASALQDLPHLRGLVL